LSNETLLTTDFKIRSLCRFSFEYLVLTGNAETVGGK